MNEKLVELLKDEFVVKELFEKETAEDAQKFLASKGVELTLEEVNQIKEQFIKIAESGEEISDEELKQVAGGSLIVLLLAPMVPDLLHKMNSAIPGSRGISEVFRRW